MRVTILHSKRAVLPVLLTLLLCMAGLTNSNAQTGALNGLFSVSDSTQVYFSQGNLQYQASTDIWRFAENQWDYVGTQNPQIGNPGGTVGGSDNVNISSTYSGWIDLFGWGTSGYEHGANAYQPWSISTNTSDYYAYGAYNNNLYDSNGQADWGYNTISNGGNTENSGWRTLTQSEWDYIFQTRITASGIRWAQGTVNGVSGTILLPDNWMASIYALNSTNGGNYSSNSITAEDWANVLEANGVVFLPAACARWGTLVNTGDDGIYWSSSYSDSNYAHNVYFSSGYLYSDDYSDRSYGLSVRLVRPAENYSFGINATANPAEGGTVSGGGIYEQGTTCTLTATPAEGYEFVNWKENNAVVSEEATYSFTVEGNRTLVAYFRLPPDPVGTVVAEYYPDPENFESPYVKLHWNGGIEGFETGDFSMYDWQLDPTYLWQISTNNPYEGSYCMRSGGSGVANVTSNMTLTVDYSAEGTISFFSRTSSEGGWDYGHFYIDGQEMGNWSGETSWEEHTYTIVAGSHTFQWRYTKDGSVNQGDDCFYVDNISFNGDDCSHYCVYRAECDNGSFSLLADNVTDVSYIDNSWLQLAVGSYQYGVCAVYNDGTTSSMKVSDCIEKHANITVTITAVPNYEERGTVSGAGNYLQGETCSLTATANEGFVFHNWTEDGQVVSTEPLYSFTVLNARNLMANFSTPAITFADPNVEAICVANWDTNGDGFLNYDEAAAVTDLGGVFRYQSNITTFNELQYFTGLTTIGELWFRNCSLTEVTLPNSVSSIGENAFYYCSNLTTVTIPNSVTSIGNWAFDFCSSLTSINLPNSIVSIGAGSFYYCSSLTSINLPNSIVSIEGGTFYHCESLVSIDIPDSVLSIGGDAFNSCYSLTTITIPSTMTYIGGFVFYECNNLVTLNYNAIDCEVEYSWLGNWDEIHPIVNLNIGEGVQVIPDGFVRNCQYLTGELVIPSSVVSIGNAAFGSCIGLSGELNIPESVTSIGNAAFYGCTGLNGNLVLPNSLTTIGDQAFYNCYGFESIVMGNSVETIGSEAFRNCGGLRGELTLPETLVSVGNHAFASCDEISTINYNAINCTEMGNAQSPVFYDCASVAHINIGANVQSIPNYAFKRCSTVIDMSVAAEVPPTIYSSTFGTVSRNIPVSVPYGSGEAYRTAQYWEEFFHITEDYSPSPYSYHWNLNVHQFGDNMTLTGIIQIDGVEQAVPYLEIGAFCNGECRGRQLLTYYPQVDRYLVFLMIYGEEGDMFTFKLYNHETNEESTAGCASVVTFEADAILGSFMEPFVFNFSDMQLSQFSLGYNWWSTYIEQEGINGLELLENSLGDNGVTIRSQASGYNDYYAGYGWYGSLSSINNESSYRVITSAPCVASMAGVPAVPSEHPITLNQGWTWMGYVPSSAMDINMALDGLEASMGDLVKSQHGYSEYYAGYGWFGSLNTIEPGTGLMYHSSNGEAVTFTYPDSNRGGELRANLTPVNNHWKPNTFAYPDNMTVMAVVELNDEELNNENYELAVFANGECRGSVKLTYAEPLHRYVAFLTISGKDAAELSFRLYDTETNVEYYDAEESLDFVADAIVGEATDLYTIHFRGTTGMDELAGRVKVYPNPVNAGERFSIGLAGDMTDIVRVEIVNTLGMVETVCTPSQQTLTAPNVAGVYTLRITVEGKGTIIKKLVVK